MAEEDFLEVDRPIPGQNYFCASFVSPEKVLKNKEIYFFTEYLKDLVTNKQTPENEKYRDKLDLMELIKKGELSYDMLKESYDGFIYSNKEKMERDFYEQNDFHTTVRGLKIRGSYDTIKEAEARAKILRKRDPNFHVFVGQVGYWVPWDPEADEVANQEYEESQLNTLVKKYNENKESRDDMYEKLKEEKIAKANKKNEETKELALASEQADAQAKISGLRELLNKKDGQYDELMDSKQMQESDPWMQRKAEEAKKKELADAVVVPAEID